MSHSSLGMRLQTRWGFRIWTRVQWNACDWGRNSVMGPDCSCYVERTGGLCIVRKTPLVRVLNSRPRIDEDCTNVLLGGLSCLS